jgi:hypothetical protein
MRLPTRAFLVALTLSACSDDAVAPGDDTTDAADTAADTTAPPDTTPVDTTPANADRRYGEVRNVLVNGRTTLITDAGAELVVTLGYTLWSAPDCPECTGQLVVSIGDGSSAACVYDGVPGAYPGQRDNGEVTLTAPATSGDHEIVWAIADAVDCAAAVAELDAGTATVALGFIVR